VEGGVFAHDEGGVVRGLPPAHLGEQHPHGEEPLGEHERRRREPREVHVPRPHRLDQGGVVERHRRADGEVNTRRQGLGERVGRALERLRVFRGVEAQHHLGGHLLGLLRPRPRGQCAEREEPQREREAVHVLPQRDLSAHRGEDKNSIAPRGSSTSSPSRPRPPWVRSPRAAPTSPPLTRAATFLAVLHGVALAEMLAATARATLPCRRATRPTRRSPSRPVRSSKPL
jgi:hypothetical protein